jgi:hypothetical protein
VILPIGYLGDLGDRGSLLAAQQFEYDCFLGAGVLLGFPLMAGAFWDFLPTLPLADFFDPDFDCLVVLEGSFDAFFEDFRFVGADSVIVAASFVFMSLSPLWSLIRA